jgi:hypothetical protein
MLMEQNMFPRQAKSTRSPATRMSRPTRVAARTSLGITHFALLSVRRLLAVYRLLTVRLVAVVREVSAPSEIPLDLSHLVILATFISISSPAKRQSLDQQPPLQPQHLPQSRPRRLWRAPVPPPPMEELHLLATNQPRVQAL